MPLTVTQGLKPAPAESYLLARVEECTARGVSRLPSLKVLSAGAGVSLRAMQAALESLKARGLLSARPKRGIEVVRLTDRQRAALSFLRQRVDEARATNSLRLPTIRDLAAATGVPVSAMAGAVARLSDAGLLKTGHRRGTWVVDERPSPPERELAAAPEPRGRKLKWLNVSTEIDRDILNGVFRHDSMLLPQKQLASRYGVCNGTLVKALDHLANRGVLRRSGTGWKVVAASMGSQTGAVVLVARGTPQGELFPLSPRTIDNLRTLEDECSRARVELIVVLVNDRGLVLPVSCRKYASYAQVMATRTVLGFIVWTMTLRDFGLPTVMSQLTARRLPIAVFDEEGELDIPVINPDRTLVTRFSLGNSRMPGRHVARFLLSLGHRRIAYISPFHDQPYSRNRADGLVEEFAAAGIGNGVELLTATINTSVGPTNRPVSEEAGELLAELTRRGWLHKSGSREVPSAVWTATWRDLTRLYREQATRDALVPLMEEALQRPDITAWVAAGDGVARECLYFLAAAGIRVPEHLTVVGFDNSEIAVRSNLTSYHFNSPAAIHAMLHHVLRPRPRYWSWRGDEPVEISGFVVERETAGKARE